MSAAASLPTLIGLILALAGPALLLRARHRLLGEADTRRTPIADQLCLLVLVACVIAVVLHWERRPLASIGWPALAWESLAWGSMLAFIFVRVLVPGEIQLLARLGLAAESGLVPRTPLPWPVLVFVTVVACVADETLVRGYAFTRIAELTDSDIFAGLITIGIVAQLHPRLRGWGPMAAYVLNTSVLTAFFAWRHDLLANVIAHTLTDLIVPLEAARRVAARGGTAA